MKPTLLFLLLFYTAAFSTATAQSGNEDNTATTTFLRRTYPVDSCLYFADPFQFRIQSVELLPGGNSQSNITRFRSVNNPDQMTMGKGRFVALLDSLTAAGVTLVAGSQGNMLLTLDESTDDAENWPGGQPPFPLVLYGFLQKVGNTVIDPPMPITMQVQRLQVEDTSQ